MGEVGWETLGWGIWRWGGTGITGTPGWGYQDVERGHQNDGDTGMGILRWGDTGMMGTSI